MAEGEKELLESAKKLPWDERIAHKNWKVRSGTYIDITAICQDVTDPKSEKLKPFGPLFAKAVSDSNAPAQEKALDALISFQKAADADAARFAKGVCNAIVSKCLNGRPKTLEKSQEAFMLWIELEAVETFMDAMETGVKAKVAKAVVPAVEAVYQALSEFGIKIVPPKRVIKVLETVLEHPDENVRKAAKGLTAELSRWIGQAPLQATLLDKLRDATKKELEQLIETLKDDKPKVTRYIRCEQDIVHEEEAVAAVSTTKAGPADEPVITGDMDVWNFVDPVDILTPLAKVGVGEDKINFWDAVRHTKWSIRRDAMTELNKLASVPRLAKGDYVELNKVLKKLVGDINVAVATEAIIAMGLLGKGLRADYSSGARVLLPALLDKLKEKKRSILDSLHTTLDALFAGGCVNLVDMLEDVKTAVGNKVPNMRAEVCKWLVRCLESSPRAELSKAQKEYIPFLIEKGLGDGTVEVREEAFNCLAALGKKLGLKPLERALEKLDDVKKKKLTEMIVDEPAPEKGAPAGGAKGASTSSTAAAAAPKRTASSLLAGNKKGVTRASSAKSSIPSAAPAKGAAKKGDSGAGGKNVAAAESSDVVVSDMSPEEIESRITSLLPAGVLAQLKSAKWQERSEALTQMRATIEGMEPAALKTNVELLVRLLAVLPGWGEKNQQVQGKAFEIIAEMAKRSPTFSKTCVVICLAAITDKIADIKLKIPASSCLLAFCESVGPMFVFDRVFKVLKDHKNPKVQAEIFTWLAKAVDEFGTTHLRVKDVIDVCRDVGLASPTPAIRTGSCKALGALHKFVGPALKGFLSDVKEALMAVVEVEFARNPYEGAPPPPKREVRGADGEALASPGADGGLPREDISRKLEDKLLEKLADPGWKIRQEALQTIGTILEEAHHRIQPTGTGELFGALKGRLNDPNKNLVAMTLELLGTIAADMGAAIDKNSRGIIVEVLKCLVDGKTQIRMAVAKALEGWASAVAVERLVPSVAAALLDSKIHADGRKDLYVWFAKLFPRTKDPNELMPFVPAVAAGLQDKSSDVRKATEEFLVALVKTAGLELVTKSCKSLKPPAALAAITPVLDKLRAAEGGGAPAEGKGAADPPPENNPPQRPGTASTKRSMSANALRGSVSKGSQAQKREAEEKRDKDAQGQPLFKIELLSKNKDEREKMYPRKLKWEEPREEHAKELEEELGKILREDLRARLFSADFKKQVEALEILHKAIPDRTGEMIEVIDMLLRWSVLKLCDTNTTSILKVLDTLPVLILSLRDANYTLTEVEANIFVPCMIEKAGHNMEKVREKMREVTRHLCSVYPVTKLLPFVVEGLRSKNNRTRVEAIENIEFLVDRYGVEIVGATKALAVVAALISEQNVDLKRAVFSCMTSAHRILGEDVWKHLGKLTDAQKDVLNEKFKWKAKELEKNKKGPASRSVSMRNSVAELAGTSETDAVGGAAVGSDITGVTGREDTSGARSPPEAPAGAAPATDGLPVKSNLANLPSRGSAPVAPEPQPLPVVEDREASLDGSGPGFGGSRGQQNGGLSSPYTWPQALSLIADEGDVEQTVEGIKAAHAMLTEAATRGTEDLNEYVNDSPRLIDMLTRKTYLTFSMVVRGGSSRPSKYVLNMLMLVFQVKQMVQGIMGERLESLMVELLFWLIDEKVQHSADGQTLIKALNVLMLKILENGHRTAAFVALIRLLRPSGPAGMPTKFHPSGGVRLLDLVVRCLIKQTKTLPVTIEEVDIESVLFAIHDYLEDLGLDEIRRRAGLDDKPLRMAKTVLHEIVKLKGLDIRYHAARLPIDNDPPPIILAYIDLNLQQLGFNLPDPMAARRAAPADAPNGQSAVQPDDRMKEILANIFSKIGHRQTSTAGLNELLNFRRQHPKVDIFAGQANVTQSFRSFIWEGLAQIEKRAGEMGNGAPRTPPPAAAGPPETHEAGPRGTPEAQGGAASSIRAGSIGHPPPPGVLVALAGGDGSGGNVVGAAGGVGGGGGQGMLDALRERMRSLQARAPGGGGGSVRNSVEVAEPVAVRTPGSSWDPQSGAERPQLSDLQAMYVQVQREMNTDEAAAAQARIAASDIALS